jgi:long-chain acyl-CoA synthetase
VAEAEVTILDGDITDPWAGMNEAAARALKGKIDVVVNCAGLVNFNPSLEVGLSVNTHGVKFLAEACVFWGVPLVHMSTAFVAGTRSGPGLRRRRGARLLPQEGRARRARLLARARARRLREGRGRLREQANDKALASEFRTRAIERLESEGRDPSDDKALRLAVGRERKLWLTLQLVRAGSDRAKVWGWPNTYTYTKSLGEQVIASMPGLRYALVRPSIVESALHYPFPGGTRASPRRRPSSTR